MAGVLFVACIPTKEHEKETNPYLSRENKTSSKPNVTIENEIGKTDGDCERVSLLTQDLDEAKKEMCLTTPEKNKGMQKKGSWDRLKDLASPNSKSDDMKNKEKRRGSRLEILPDTNMEEVSYY